MMTWFCQVRYWDIFFCNSVTPLLHVHFLLYNCIGDSETADIIGHIRANLHNKMAQCILPSSWHRIDGICYECERLFTVTQIEKCDSIGIEKIKIDNIRCLWWKSRRRNKNVVKIIHCRWLCGVSLLFLHTVSWFSFFLRLPAFKCTDYHAKAQRRVWGWENKRSERWLYTNKIAGLE